MEERYSKNLGALTEQEIETLHSKRVCVVGCGGIGGYIVELFARLGIGTLTVVDGDSFAVSNLNRQLLSVEALIGHSKADAAHDRVRAVNSQVLLKTVPSFLTKENADGILQNHDIVIDALDNIPSRRILADACGRLGLTLVHGAISGWRAQIAVIAPNCRAFDFIYPEEQVAFPQSSLSFTPALAAAIQTAEAVKVLLNREVSLDSKLLIVDLLTQEYNTVKL